jgi:hypothetical protein
VGEVKGQRGEGEAEEEGGHALFVLAVLAAACGRGGDSQDLLGDRPGNHPKPQQVKTSEVLTRDASGLHVEQGPKGKRVRLDGTYQSAAVAHRAPDCSVHGECFDEAEHAEAFMNNAPGAASRSAEVK